MLLTLPVELHADILKHLPRRDLACVVRTCRHLHAVGVTLLYAHVELHSLDQVEAFFQITSLLPQGSAVASRHLEAKNDQWKAIKTLEIDVITTGLRREPLGKLPEPLRGQGVDAFPLDRLRLSYGDCAPELLPILQRFNPRELGLRRVAPKRDDPKVFDPWMSATGWKDVTHLTLVGEKNFDGFGTSAKDSTIRFVNVKHLTLVCHYYSSHSYFGPCLDTTFLVLICPNADKLAMLVSSPWAKQEAELLVKQGLAGKPVSFYSVAYEPVGSNVWGEVEKPEEGPKEELKEKSESSSEQDPEKDSQDSEEEEDSAEDSDEDA